MTTRFDPKMFLARVGEGKMIVTFKAGAVIFKQGTPAEHVYYVQSGKAQESVTSEQGKDAVIGLLEPGLFFGTGALDGEEMKHLSTVTAITPCIITAITPGAMKKALQKPEFAQLFLAYLLHHNRVVEAEKLELLFNDSERRLMKRLLVLAQVEIAGEPPKPIGPEITQEMLAQMIGTTRPRINYFLNRFRNMGLIKYNGSAHKSTHTITVLPGLLQVVLQDDVVVERA